MKTWMSGVFTVVAANPAGVAAVSVFAAAIAAHYGFHVTAADLAATATAFAGGFAHKAHTSAKAAAVKNLTIPANPVGIVQNRTVPTSPLGIVPNGTVPTEPVGNNEETP